MKKTLLIFVVILSILAMGSICIAKEKPSGQTLFLALGKLDVTIPGSKVPQKLNSRIFFRNTDLFNEIYIISIRIFDPDGKEIHKYDKIALGPMASTSFILGEEIKPVQSPGRHSAIITWESRVAVNPPSIAAAILITAYPEDSKANAMTQTHSIVQAIPID